MESVQVRSDLQYASCDAGPLTLDFYLPPSPDEPLPAVVVVTGYPDVGVRRPLGCAFKEMAMWTSLARLLAASGLAAVTYTAHDPFDDLGEVLDYVSSQALAPSVDAARIAFWAFSGHVPTALATLARRRAHHIKSAVISTGFTLDLEGSAVADAARAYGFANPSAGMAIDDLPSNVPLFIARAGRDENHGLNGALDRFLAAALAQNLPVTLVNHGEAGHAFEITHDNETSRHVIRQMLSFVHFWTIGARWPQ